ncbi:hypothetical protein [Alistipes sp. ZOR0009]|uniref:hypothetical protein n=1 Tax=Alistipes sp. ZOR0009 TaxID=1339253 RepID=UPI0006484399|nr:hypothetical protein [Alistipes sp. ZOR0009]
MERYCKFCGKVIIGRRQFCNDKEKRLYRYNIKKGLSEEEIKKISQSLLDLSEVKNKPYKAARMESLNIPISPIIREYLRFKFDKKSSEFVRNELMSFLILPEDKKKYRSTLELKKLYCIVVPGSAKRFLESLAKSNLRSVQKELSIFIFMLYDKIHKEPDFEDFKNNFTL